MKQLQRRALSDMRQAFQVTPEDNVAPPAETKAYYSKRRAQMYRIPWIS